MISCLGSLPPPNHFPPKIRQFSDRQDGRETKRDISPCDSLASSSRMSALETASKHSSDGQDHGSKNLMFSWSPVISFRFFENERLMYPDAPTRCRVLHFNGSFWRWPTWWNRPPSIQVSSWINRLKFHFHSPPKPASAKFRLSAKVNISFSCVMFRRHSAGSYNLIPLHVLKCLTVGKVLHSCLKKLEKACSSVLSRIDQAKLLRQPSCAWQWLEHVETSQPLRPAGP